MLGYTIWACYQSENPYTLRIRDAHGIRRESWHVAYTQCAAFGQQYVTHSGGTHCQADKQQPGWQASTPVPGNIIDGLLQFWNLAELRQQATGDRQLATGNSFRIANYGSSVY